VMQKNSIRKSSGWLETVNSSNEFDSLAKSNSCKVDEIESNMSTKLTLSANPDAREYDVVFEEVSDVFVYHIVYSIV
jgi:hypothetical protein